MKEIDFTPQWYVQTLAEQRGSWTRVIALSVLAVLLLIAARETTGLTQSAVADLQRLEQAQAAQTLLSSRLDALEAERAEVNRKEQVLKTVGGGVKNWQLMTELSQMMPRSLSLRSLTVRAAARVAPPSDEEDKQEKAKAKTETEDTPLLGVVQMSGWASSGAEVGGFVSRLSQSPLFTDVTLRYQRPEDLGGTQIVSFEVICTMPAFE
jgi:hypothetical protein